MTREEVRGVLARELKAVWYKYDCAEVFIEQAEAILNLKQECGECGGSGEYIKDVFATHDTVIPCPTCKGAGGERVLKTQEDCDKCHEIRSVKV